MSKVIAASNGCSTGANKTRLYRANMFANRTMMVIASTEAEAKDRAAFMYYQATGHWCGCKSVEELSGEYDNG